jgi:hypothetical protein
MKIATHGRRGAFPKVLIAIIIATSCFLYLPFISKAFLPSALIQSVTNTPTSSILVGSQPKNTHSSFNSFSAAAAAVSTTTSFHFFNIINQLRISIN